MDHLHPPVGFAPARDHDFAGTPSQEAPTASHIEISSSSDVATSSTQPGSFTQIPPAHTTHSVSIGGASWRLARIGVSGVS